MSSHVSSPRFAVYAALQQTVGAVAHVMGSIARGMGHLSDANHRAHQAQALMALSDEALAERGLKREDIVRHVFAGMMV